jgi:hypothetical protein
VDIISVVVTVLKRWRITVPIVLLAVGVAVLVESRVPPQFTASGSLLLSHPELDPSRLPLATDDLERILGGVQSAADEGELADGDGEVALRRLDSESIELTVIASSEARGWDVTQAVADTLGQEISELQEANEVPPGERTEVVQSEAEIVSPEEAQETEIVSVLYLHDPTAGIDNPFGATSQTARVLQVALESDRGYDALEEAAGHRMEYAISQTERDEAPIIEVQTVGDSASRVLGDFELVVDAVARELEARQARALVPETRRVVIEVIAAPETVEDVSPPVSRLAAAIIGLGGIAALGTALLAESIARRRERGDDDLDREPPPPEAGDAYTSFTSWSAEDERDGVAEPVGSEARALASDRPPQRRGI